MLYPPEAAVIAIRSDTGHWENYKKSLIADVKKARWPKEHEQIRLSAAAQEEASTSMMSGTQ